MQVRNGEGLVIHAGPESCAAVRKGRGEAWTGGRAGQVLSREITSSGSRRRSWKRKATLASRHDETKRVPARSETLRTHGSATRENRDVPGLPTAGQVGGRIGKPEGESR